MSRYRDNTTVWLEYDGLKVCVVIEFEVDVDPNYGADADGNRGMRHVEVDVVDKYVESPKVNLWRKEQVDEILSAAESKFYSMELWKGGTGPC